ncbi:MAG: hypothetical protein WCD69_26795, partial [Xanthobacteraceae bacterium]
MDIMYRDTYRERKMLRGVGEMNFGPGINTKRAAHGSATLRRDFGNELRETTWSSPVRANPFLENKEKSDEKTNSLCICGCTATV